jgi:phage/conjugal plasmid C-4 type zinc finger TraR family protein
VGTDMHGRARRPGRETNGERASTTRGRTHGPRPATQLIRLAKERRALKERGRQPGEGTPDPLDAAKALEEERLWLAVLGRRNEIQDRIEEAAQLLGEGRYGRCVECGTPIPKARLQALPFAVRCVACQEWFETRSRRLPAPHASA